jgi:hypothetical protein
MFTASGGPVVEERMKIEDRRAVEAAVENWMNAWDRRDPDLAVRDYAEEA